MMKPMVQFSQQSLGNLPQQDDGADVVAPGGIESLSPSWMMSSSNVEQPSRLRSDRCSVARCSSRSLKGWFCRRCGRILATLLTNCARW
mmetsp:Transcript_8504/g.7218  ORF Transcript_8504/g.7218 Transcript_8504/m.7218 type:complete len:89 (+) Transcript_8504:1-267(+)